MITLSLLILDITCCSKIWKVWCYETRQKYNRRKKKKWHNHWLWQYVGDFPLNVCAPKTEAVQEQSNQVNPVICFGNGHYTQIWPDMGRSASVTFTELHVNTSNICSIWGLISSLEALLWFGTSLGFFDAAEIMGGKTWLWASMALEKVKLS